jgi:hypothetical protein
MGRQFDWRPGAVAFEVWPGQITARKVNQSVRVDSDCDGIVAVASLE